MLAGVICDESRTLPGFSDNFMLPVPEFFMTAGRIVSWMTLLLGKSPVSEIFLGAMGACRFFPTELKRMSFKNHYNDSRKLNGTLNKGRLESYQQIDPQGQLFTFKGLYVLITTISNLYFFINKNHTP